MVAKKNILQVYFVSEMNEYIKKKQAIWAKSATSQDRNKYE